MVGRGQPGVPAGDHRHVVPASVCRHDHSRGVADQHDVPLDRPGRRPEDRDETAGRFSGLETTSRDEFVEQVAQVPAEALPGPEADVRASRLRDDPRVSARREVAEDHVGRAAEAALRGRAHRGRRNGPLEPDRLRDGRSRAVGADDDLALEGPAVRFDPVPSHADHGRLRPELRAFMHGLRGDPVVHLVAPDGETPERDVVSPTVRGPDPDDGGVDFSDSIWDLHEVLEFGDGRKDRPDLLVVGDILATLDRHADLLSLIDEQDLQSSARRIPSRGGTGGPRADDDDVVGRGHRAAPSRLAREDVVDELDHARLRVALRKRVEGLLCELAEGERLRAGLLDRAGVPEEPETTLDILLSLAALRDETLQRADVNRGSVVQGVDGDERHIPFSQVRARPLPEARAVPDDVEDVVHDLEGDAEVQPVLADRLDVVVDQGRGVDQLEGRGEIDRLGDVRTAQGPEREQGDHRPDALPAGVNHVPRDVMEEGFLGHDALPDLRLDEGHLLGYPKVQGGRHQSGPNLSYRLGLYNHFRGMMW